MSSLPRSAAAALLPVRAELRRGSGDEAQEILAEALRQAEEIRVRGRTEADRIRARADAEGRASAHTEAALRSARARRRAGRIVLAREEALREELRARVLAEAEALRSDPRYPLLLEALREQARALLDPGAHLEEAPAGGITGVLGSRSVDLSLPALAGAALERHAKEVRELWQQ
ncbi:hypothetical protein [Arthrobacter luteolus]|uniref:hypothetical protein n=1 Tax=Arthrobacter luteolus TaxID=98672 RepID=UPI00082FCCA0|nr:hypothetical protein [Arthrobacter luteolus]